MGEAGRTLTGTMRYAADTITRLEEARRVEAFLCAKALHALHGGGEGQAVFERHPLARFMPSKKELLDTSGGVGDLFRPGQAALLAAIDTASLLGKLDILRVPIERAPTPVAGAPLAYVVDEGTDKTPTVITFDAAPAPVKVAALLVVSAELFRAFSEANATLVRRLLIAACARRQDVWLIATLTGGGAVVPTATDLAGRAGEVLGALGTAARPALVIGLQEAPTFASAIAGLEAAGVTVIASAAANGVIIALDLAGLAAATTDPELVIGRNASVSLGGSPASVVNLFHANLLGLRVERYARLAQAGGSVAWATAAAA